MLQVCVCEENYNGYLKCRNKNCLKFHPLTIPKKTLWTFLILFFREKNNFEFIEYYRKYNRGDCTGYK